MKYLKYFSIAMIIAIIITSVPMFISVINNESTFYKNPVLVIGETDESQRIWANTWPIDFVPNKSITNFQGIMSFNIKVREKEYETYFDAGKDIYNPFGSIYFRDLKTGDKLSQSYTLREFDEGYSEEFSINLEFKNYQIMIPEKAIIATNGNSGKNGKRIDPEYEFELVFSFTTYLVTKDSFFGGFNQVSKTEYAYKFRIDQVVEMLYIDMSDETPTETNSNLKFTDMISFRFRRFGESISSWMRKDFGGEKNGKK